IKTSFELETRCVTARWHRRMATSRLRAVPCQKIFSEAPRAVAAFDDADGRRTAGNLQRPAQAACRSRSGGSRSDATQYRHYAAAHESLDRHGRGREGLLGSHPDAGDTSGGKELARRLPC